MGAKESFSDWVKDKETQKNSATTPARKTDANKADTFSDWVKLAEQRKAYRFSEDAAIDSGYINQYLSDHNSYWSGYGSGKDDADNPNYRLDERRASINSWLESSLADGTIDQDYYDQVAGLLGDADRYVGMYQGQRDLGSYVEDWGKWYSDAASALDTMDWTTGIGGSSTIDAGMAGFADRDAAAREWLETYRGDLGEKYYDSMLSELDSFSGYADELRGAYDQNAKYFGQWDSQEAYDRYGRLKDLNVLQEQGYVNELEKAVKEMEQLEDDLAFNMIFYSEEDQANIQRRYRELQRLYGADSKEAAQSLSAAKTDLADATEIQGAIEQARKEAGWQQKYDGISYYDLSPMIEKVQDPEEKAWLEQYAPTVMTDQDYSIALGEINTELYELEKLAESLADDPLNQEHARLQELGMRDASEVNDRIEDLKRQKWQLEQNRQYAFLDQEEDFEELSKTVAPGRTKSETWNGIHDSTYDWINDLDGYREEAIKRYAENDPYYNYWEMDQGEIDRYNYIYQTQGEEAANNYLSYLEPALEQRLRQKEVQMFTLLTQKAPLLSNALSVPMNLLGGAGILDIGAQNLLQDITGDYRPINYNNPTMTFTYGTKAVRGTTAEMITDATGTIQLDEKKHPVLSTILNGRGLADVYQLGMSAIDSKVAAMTGNPYVATALLAGSAATDGVLDALERGATDEQALQMGMWNGAFEALFEFVEVENLLKGDPSWIKAVTNQAITEGLGEGFTSIANNIADGIIMADKSALRQAAAEYENQGLSPEEAYRKAFADMMVDIGWDIIGGAVSGGLSAGGQIGINNVITNRQYNALPQELRSSAERMQGLGLDKSTALDRAEALYELAQKYGDQAKSFQMAYDPKQDVYDYAQEFNTAYEIGRNNGDQEYLGKLTTLSESQRSIAYGLGVEAQQQKKAERSTDTSEEKSAAETTYDVSEEGKAIDTTTGEAIEIESFKSVGSEAELTISGGKTVKAKDVSYASADDAAIYEVVGRVAGSASNANSILKAYQDLAKDGMSATDFAAALQRTYDLGVAGQIPERQLGSDDLAGMLPKGIRSVVYGHGKRVGDVRAAARDAEVRKQGRRASGQRDGKLHFDRNGRTFSKVQEASLGAMEALSKALGVDIYIYESYKEGGKRVYQSRSGEVKSAPNGWYDPDTGTIHIDLNAGNFGQGTMMFTVAHELTHFIKDWSPVKFRKLASLLVERYGEQGVSVQELIDRQISKAKSNGREIDRDTAFEEVVADSMETMLTKGDAAKFMAQLQQKDKTLWQKVKGWFKDLADKLRGVVESYGDVKPDSAEGRLVAQMEDFIQVLQEAYSEALVDAAANYRAADGQKNTTREGGVKYSFGVTQEDIDAYVDAAYNKTNTEDYKKYAIVSEKLYNDVLPEVNIKDYNHALRDNDIRHIRNSHGENTNEKYPVTKQDIKEIPWLVENYDKVYVVKRSNGKVGIIYVKAVDYGLVYYLEQVTTKIGNEPLLVNKQMIKTGISDIPGLPGLKDAITKKQSETEFLNDLKKAQQVYAQSVYQSHSMNTIPHSSSDVNQETKEKRSDREYLAAVERGDMATAQRMVDESAKTAGAWTLPSGKVRKYYHGTSQKFTEFDVDKSRLGNHGFGIYLTMVKDFASDYGEPMSAFLLTDRIASNQDHQITEDQVQSVADYFGIDLDSIKAGLADSNDASILQELQKAIVRETSAKPSEILSFLQTTFGYEGLRVARETVLWDKFLVKSADPVTYDDAGNVIPLSERFDTTRTDIRYSDRDSSGAELTQEQDRIVSELGATVNAKTESVAPSVLFSERTWTASDYVQEREEAALAISKAIGVTPKKAKQYIDDINSIAKMIAEDRTRLDYFSSPNRSSFVGNVEYGGSFDFSTLCKKRRLLTGTFTAIQKALPNTALTADEILEIRDRMKKAGLEVSCGLCYVEGSRANMGQFAKEFLKLYKQYYPDAWQPNMADVNTPDGIEWVRINHPECYEQYEYFWNHYGTMKQGDKNLFASQQKPKLYQLHTEYKGEILQKFKNDDNVEEKNLNGGIRLQSFSDFEIVHLIDTMQIIMDMSRVGLAGQAYTKVPDFAWALGDTGLKINLSLIAKGVDENGRLVFDNVEGMPIEEAMRLRQRYSENVGTILVVFNDQQLMAAMADDRVDFIIPFHRSQWKRSQYEAMGLPAKTKDYTYMQNEKFIKPQYHEYRGRMVRDKATNYMPNEYWDFSKSGKENAEDYLEMCARNNKRPKFYKLLTDNHDGSYSLKADGSTDGYWKLLIDFKMYDNQGNGSPQRAVTPDFNMEEANRMLNEYKGGHSSFPVAQGIVDDFVAEYKESHKGQLLSDRDPTAAATAEELEKQGKKLQGDVEELMELLRLQGGPTQITNHGLEATANYLKNLHGVVDSKQNPGPTEELEKLLGDFYGYINANSDLSWEQIAEKAKPVTQWIQKHTPRSRQRSEYVRNVLAEIRNKPIQLTEAERSQAAEGYESYDAFRKAAMGSVTLVNDGGSLENALQEWSRLYPGAFDAVMEADNKTQALMEMIHGLRSADTTELEYAYIIDMAEQEIARSVYDSYWRLNGLHPVKNKNTQAMNELRRNHRAKMNVLKQDQETAVKTIQAERERTLTEIRNEYRSETMAAVEAAKRKYQEKREKAAESKNKAAIRHKIREFKKRMESRLLHPTDQKYVPESLAKAMIEVCELIDTDTELYKKDGSINKAQVQRNLTKEKLGDLKDAYEKLRTDPDLGYQDEYDEELSGYLGELKENYAGKQLSEMSTEELKSFYNVLVSIEETLRDAKKLIGWQDAQSVFEAGDAIMAEQKAITQSRKGGKRNAAQIARDTMLNYSLSPVRNVERMSGYHNDSYLLALFKKFEEGIRKKNKFVMDAYKGFENLTAGKEYDDALYNEVGGKKYTDINGRTFGVSKMQMMQAILSQERETANGMDHIKKGGFTFADLDMLKKGKLKDAISEENAHRVPKAASVVAEFREALKNDKWCQEYMAAARKFFNETAKGAINETTLTLKHRIVARDKSYIPFEVDKNFVNREISAEHDIQQTISAYGMLKETSPGSPQPLIITGLNNVIDRHIDRVGNVYGLAVAVRNFNKVWNASSKDGSRTVKAVIQMNWGDDGVKHIDQAVRDIQSPRTNAQSAVYQKIKSGYIGSTFALNLSVVFKQIGSMYSATSMIRWRDPFSMTANLIYTMVNHKKIAAEVDKYTATAWMRRQGMSDAEVHTLLTQTQKSRILRVLDKAPAIFNPVKWITAMDSSVALSLWKYAKEDTAERTGLKGEALMAEAAKFYDEVVENTQSMTDVLHRPEVQKRGDVVSEAFGTFKTDLYQMAGQLQTVLGRFTENKTKENAQTLGRTAYAATMSILWGQLMTVLFAMIRYKVNPYRDEEDKDLTAESLLKRVGFQLAGEFMGYIFPVFGGEAMGLVENVAYGETSDAVDNIALTAVNDLIDITLTLASSIKDGELPDQKDMEKAAVKALQMFGVPANNIQRTIKAIELHAQDIANGEFLSFEAGADRTTTNHIYRIAEELDRGDTERAQEYFNQAVEEISKSKAEGEEYGPEEVKDAKSQLKSTLGKLYKDGLVTRSIAENMLRSYWEQEDEDVYWTFDEWDYAMENGSSDGYKKNRKVYAATLSGEDISGAMKELTDHGKDEEDVLSELKTQIMTWYTDPESNIKITRDQAQGMLQQYFDLDSEEIEAQLLNWDMKLNIGFSPNSLKDRFMKEAVSQEEAVQYLIEYSGMDPEDAQAKVDDWVFEAENGYNLDDIRQTYLDEDITAEEARTVLMERAGKTREQADYSLKLWDFEDDNGWRYEDRASLYKDGKITREQLRDALVSVGEYESKDAGYQIEVYDWEMEGLDGATVNRVERWHEYCQTAGVSKEMFLQIHRFSADTKNDVDENGKTINFSAMKKVMAKIDALPLTAGQKDALARSLGWSEKNIKKYKPW